MLGLFFCGHCMVKAVSLIFVTLAVHRIPLPFLFSGSIAVCGIAIQETQNDSFL